MRSERASDDDANFASGVPPSPEHQRRRRSRNEGEEDEDDGGLELPHLKKRRIVELPSDSEEEWSPIQPSRLDGGRWPDEGPSDPRVEIWEEVWDDRLEEEFEKEKKRARDLVVTERDVGSSENGFKEGTEEEYDRYKTDLIEWEAKEVIDLVSTSDDSG